MLRYEKPVFSLIVRMVRDRQLAEDLSQETFIKAHRALASYNPERRFSSWLFKIAHNTTIDHLRRQRIPTAPLQSGAPESPSLADVLEDRSAPSPAAQAEAADLATALEQALVQLRAEYREVVVLRFSQGLAYQEIAEVTGLPIGTVKTHLHRARKQLMRILEEQGWAPAGRRLPQEDPP